MSDAGQQRLLIDEDHLGYLVWETTSEAKSVIVFCATKAWCARSAGFLASRLPLYRLLAAAAWLASPAAVSRLRHMSSSSPPASLSEVLSFSEEAAGEKEIDAQSQASSPLRTASLRGPPPSGDSAASAGPSWLQAVPQPLLEELLLFAPSLFVSPPLQQGREDLLNLLRHAAGPESGLCPVQERAIRAGVAYHHAGLEGTARTAIEIAFQQGVLSVLCATSTLALGVNLPASRVILRSPEIGNETLDVARFRQMAGRAGRTGYTERGEAFLFCSSKQLPACLALISGSPMSRVSLSPPTGLSSPSPNQEALDAVSCRQHSFASNLHAETERALKAVPERSLAALAPAVSPAVRTAQDWLAQDGGETFSSSVRSQLQGLHLCRALLESCETLLPLSLLFPSKCFLRGRKISGERGRGLGALRAGRGGARLGDREEGGAFDLPSQRPERSKRKSELAFAVSSLPSDSGNEQTRTCLFSPRENAEEEQEREDGEEEKEESRTEREEEGHLPVISRLFSLVRLCTLRGKQTPRKQMESELHACVAYLHENYLLETRGSAAVSSPARVADGADGGPFVPSESEEAATHKAGEHDRERCTDALAGVSRAWEGGLEGAICMRRFTAFLRRDLEEKRNLYIAAAEEARRAQQTLQTLPEASSEVYIHPESARREQVVVRADATGPGAAVPSPLRRTSSLSPESCLHNHGANFHPSSFSPSSDPLPLSPASSSPSHRASGSPSSPSSCAGSLPVSAASQLPGGDPRMQRRRSLEQASAKAAQDATLLKRQFVLSCREHRGLACTLRRMPHLRSPPLLVCFFLHELSEFSSSSCASPSLYCNAVCSQRVLPRCMHSGDAAVSAVSVGASRPGDEAAEGRKAAEREETLAETVYACGSPSVPCVRPSALRSISPNAHRAPREMGETPRDKKQTEDGEKALKPADDNAMTVTKTEATEKRSSMPAASRSLAVQTPQRMHAQKDALQGADILSPGLSGSGGGRRDADTNTEEAGPVSGSRTGDKTQKQTETGQKSSEQRLQVTQMRRGSSAMLGALAQHAKDEFSRAVSQSFRLPRLLLLKLQLAFSRPTSVASWNPRSSSPSSFRRSYGQGARDRQAGIDESDATLASLSSRTSAGEEQKDGEKNRRSLAARKEKKSERDRARTYERWSQTTFVSCTYLGSAAVETGLNPWEALEAFADLYKAVHQGLCLRSDLHLLYLGAAPIVSPTNLSWVACLRVYDNLDLLSRKFADSLGISRAFLLRASRTAPRKGDCLSEALATGGATAAAHAVHRSHQLLLEDRITFQCMQNARLLLCHRRFFVALQLFEVLSRDAPLCRVAEKSVGQGACVCNATKFCQWTVFADSSKSETRQAASVTHAGAGRKAYLLA
ncbi:DEAD/DEAH box helicase domain-containing protein [Toxoplasma gondii RUB]|uniref:DEAD/DEAH box helicase domain-containing protein n=1 Tax=Toxoplasma gondii RUB TaxID=935652 RepID=A0A086M3T3_TOXGO|nr:DEAD/DEAH box helicase domain-containing protein [Toxoplasma gondii RUB]